MPATPTAMVPDSPVAAALRRPGPPVAAAPAGPPDGTGRASRKRAGARTRPQPERMCVVCRTRRGKRDLVRVARLADGRVVVDETGKGPGRGAYLCRRRACWLAKGLDARLGAQLKMNLTAEDRARVAAFAATLPEDTDGE